MKAALWRAAEVLRDRVDASTARDVMLTLIAVRHLDPSAWQRVGHAGLQRVVADIVARRPDLDGAFPGLPDLRENRLHEVVEALDTVPGEADGDMLGEAYMRLLGDFARAEGRRGGQYYTPRSVTRLAVALIEPVVGTVYDPCCGSGGLLVEARAAAPADVRVVGQELNPATHRLARLNGAVHDMALDLGPRPADTLAEDLHPTIQADRVVANPPFNLARWAGADDDPRWRYGTPPRGNANLAWIQHIAAHLAPGGLASVILANGSLTAQGAERDIRRALVEAGVVEAVVALPDRLFLTTPIPACVWVLSRPSRPRDHVLFVDARARGRRETRALTVLDEHDVSAISEVVAAHREGAQVDIPGFARAVPHHQVGPAGTLAPGAWVEISTAPNQGRPIGALVAQARAQLAEMDRLDEALRAALDDLDPP